MDIFKRRNRNAYFKSILMDFVNFKWSVEYLVNRNLDEVDDLVINISSLLKYKRDGLNKIRFLTGDTARSPKKIFRGLSRTQVNSLFSLLSSIEDYLETDVTNSINDKYNILKDKLNSNMK